MSEKHEIKVGQEVFIEKGSFPESRIVTKVGRKFFYLKAKYAQDHKFDLETLREVTNFGNSRLCYLSLQDLKDLNERRRCFSVLRSAYGNAYSLTDEMTLDKLRRMVAIWEEKEA